MRVCLGRLLCAGGLSRRIRESLFNFPSAFETLVNASIPETKSSAPLHESESLPVVGNEPVRSHIVTLLNTGLPSHISRFVTSIVINSSKRMLCGRWIPDIGKKSTKISSPDLTNTNSSTSIVLVRSVGPVFTSTNHGLPGLEDLGRSPVPPMTVLDSRQSHRTGSFNFEAPARSRVQVCEATLPNDDGHTTVATAKPHSWYSAMTRCLQSYGDQSAKSSSADVYRARHGAVVTRRSSLVKCITVRI